VIATVLATGAIAVLSVGANFVFALSCLGDHRGAYGDYCSHEHVLLAQWFVALGPPVGVLLAGGVGFVRRTIVPVLVVGIFLAPVAIVLPWLIWGAE